MYRTCIAIADATRARLFIFDRSVDAEGTREQLIEQTDLVDIARHLRPGELFTGSHQGNQAGGLRYGFDDHRASHIDEMDREFARAIAADVERTLQGRNIQRLVVCASPRMLGNLRKEIPARNGLIIDELARDYVKLSITELRDQLAGCGLLPARPPGRALQAS